MTGVIEMRIYKVSAGKREEFLELFRSKVIPAQRRVGMKVLGPFLSFDDPDDTISQRWEPQDTFFWMRRFPDLASRRTMKSAFYDGELWTSELESQIMPLIEEMDVVLVDDSQGVLDRDEWVNQPRTPT
jgi:NIPSNAP